MFCRVVCQTLLKWRNIYWRRSYRRENSWISFWMERYCTTMVYLFLSKLISESTNRSVYWWPYISPICLQTSIFQLICSCVIVLRFNPGLMILFNYRISVQSHVFCVTSRRWGICALDNSKVWFICIYRMVWIGWLSWISISYMVYSVMIWVWVRLCNLSVLWLEIIMWGRKNTRCVLRNLFLFITIEKWVALDKIHIHVNVFTERLFLKNRLCANTVIHKTFFCFFL